MDAFPDSAPVKLPNMGSLVVNEEYHAPLQEEVDESSERRKRRPRTKRYASHPGDTGASRAPHKDCALKDAPNTCSMCKSGKSGQHHASIVLLFCYFMSLHPTNGS